MSREFRLFFNSWSGSGHDKFNTSRFVPSGTQRHRWLPLRGKDAYLLANQTPIADSEYDPYGPGWRRWQIAAQQHYSFLEHLENNELWRYKFNIWDFKTKRMGIQLVAMMGKDINAAKPIPKDDEFHFGITMPRKLSRLAVADGRGVAAHYSFRTQLTSEIYGGLRSTDILDRYRAFARESICAKSMLWRSYKDDPELFGKHGPQYGPKPL
ncbi:hypothetical protein ACO1O0_005878 [Amphichorda felina]